MANADENRELSKEAAQALLTAIKDAAPDAYRKNGSDGVAALAQAYAHVHETMQKAEKSPRGMVM